jgi:hypothetical protein
VAGRKTLHFVQDRLVFPWYCSYDALNLCFIGIYSKRGVMSFFKKVITLLAIIFFTQSAFAESPELLWERGYHAGSKDIAYGVATDRDGNIIVAGTSESDYLVIKYDADGNVLWKVPYDSSGPDTAYAVAIDSLNNIVVAGVSTVYSDWYIIKYDESGREVWSKTLNLGLNDIARSVAVDSNDNIIVAGHNTFREDFEVGNTWDYFTIKYDSNGNYLWYKNYNLFDDRAYGVTVDSGNSVVVVGASEGDIHTIKYDSNGNELWSTDFDSGYKDYGRGVTADSSGNVVVVGYSFDPSAFTAYAVILKYDSYGNELWRRAYSRSTFDYTYCVTTDCYDNIILGGKSDGSINVVIYDKNGNLIWEYNHSDFIGSANSVDVDDNNDIVVAGFLYTSGTGSDYQVMKFRGYELSTLTTECQCPADSTGCISGQVTKKNTGEPLAGKTVKLKRRSPRRPRVKELAVTDSNGCYSFTDLEEGTYKIKVKRCRGGGKKFIEVTDGGKVEDVSFQCRR